MHKLIRLKEHIPNQPSVRCISLTYLCWESLVIVVHGNIKICWRSTRKPAGHHDPCYELAYQQRKGSLKLKIMLNKLEIVFDKSRDVIEKPCNIKVDTPTYVIIVRYQKSTNIQYVIKYDVR